MTELIAEIIAFQWNLNYTQQYGIRYTLKALVSSLTYRLGANVIRDFDIFEKILGLKKDFYLHFGIAGNKEKRKSSDVDQNQKNLSKSSNEDYLSEKLTIYSIYTLIILSNLMIVLIPAILSSVDLISMTMSSIMTFAFTFFTYRFQFFWTKFFKKERDKITQGSDNIINHGKFKSILCLLLATLFSFILPNLFGKVCLAYYNPSFGFEWGPFTVSTQFTRSYVLPEICPPNEICHIYTTLAEDATTKLIINIHTGINLSSSLQIHFDKVDNFQVTNSFEFSKGSQNWYLDIEPKGARYVHSIYLDNLIPNTNYYCRIFYDDQMKGETNFSTFSTSSTIRPFLIAQGGDAGSAPIVDEFFSQLEVYRPDVVIIAGDVVYDNGNLFCYYCWDLLLNKIDRLNKKLGKLIPIILTVGNHDLGIDEYQYIPIDKRKNLLFFYFPQHSKIDQNGNMTPLVPDPEERMSYFSIRIGEILFIILDSSYIVASDTEQLIWLDNLASRHPNLTKIGVYHNPIFPACMLGLDPSDERVLTWHPLFEKYLFAGVFENHYHLHKRTFPYKTSSDSNSLGVVYFGDGNMGANPNSCFEDDGNPNRTGIFATLSKKNTIWMISVTNQTAQYFPIDSKGQMVDEPYIQNLSMFRN